MTEGNVRRTLGPISAVALAATLAGGVAIGHWAWTDSAASTPRTTANGGSGTQPFGPGGTVHFGKNGSFSYTYPGGSVSGGPGGFSYSGPGGTFTTPGYPGGSQSSGSGSQSQSNVSSAITSKVDPGLVDINTTLVDNEGKAAGTGMVVTSSGEVFTNNHVIAGAVKITATDVGNGQTYTAKVVGYDYHHDIAVLQLENASGLKTVTLGDSSTVTKGQSITTIGNAGGVGGTPSAASGEVTGLGQSITAEDDAAGTAEHLSNLIAINGDLQPGDSGGPLVDSSGDVVGMDTAASSTFTFQGGSDQGFAIPINFVKQITSEILAGQSSSSIHIGETAFLGVIVESGSNGVSGAQIERVVSGTPAASSGLAAGDTITALDGTSVASPQALTDLMLQHHPGDQVTFTYKTSSGSTETTTVTLANGPSQ
jgi:S1-C subfamily serine protease